MAGICGFLGTEDKKLLKEMSGFISHRGSNEIFLIDKTISLLERNFDNKKRILENEDGSTYLVADASIYNYEELKNDLEKKGHDFATDFKEEVIVHLYEELNSDCCGLIDGDFSFAIWDTNKKQLLMARDKIGIRPLYYTIDSRGLIFASELKPLLSTQDKIELCYDGLLYKLIFNSIPPPYTLYNNLLSIPPGSFLELTKNKSQIKNYWSPKLKINPLKEKSCNEISKLFYDKFKVAVGKRIGEDNNVLLSGGVESSAMVATLNDLQVNPIKTFTFEVMGQKEWSEIPYATIVSDYFDTIHTNVIVDPDSIGKNFFDLIWKFDEPYDGMFFLNELMNKIHSVSKENATLFVGNDMATFYYRRNMIHLLVDNLFFFLSIRNINSDNNLVKIIGKIFTFANTKILNNKYYQNEFELMEKIYDKNEYIKKKYFHINNERNSLLTSSRLDQELKDEIERICSYVGNKYIFYTLPYLLERKFRLLGDIMKLESESSQHSLCLTLPFDDMDFIDFSLRIHPTIKTKRMKGNKPFFMQYSSSKNSKTVIGKYLIRQAFKEKLPKPILLRTKAVSPSTYLFLNGPFGEIVEQILSEPKILKNKFLNKEPREYMGKIIEKFLNTKRDWVREDEAFISIVFSIVVLEGIYRTFIERDDIRKPIKF